MGHETETIELVLPADTRMVRLARLVASGVATAAGFDVDDVEDFRIAVDEMCAALIEAGIGRPLLLGFDMDEDCISVLGTTASDGTASFELERLALSAQILRVVVDEHEMSRDAGHTRLRLLKRRSN